MAVLMLYREPIAASQIDIDLHYCIDFGYNLADFVSQYALL